MKPEYINAFMYNNRKRFNESDLAAIQNRLEKVDDKYFPMLMGLSFFRNGWVTFFKILTILIMIAGIAFIVYTSTDHKSVYSGNNDGNQWWHSTNGVISTIAILIAECGLGYLLYYLYQVKKRNIKRLFNIVDTLV